MEWWWPEVADGGLWTLHGMVHLADLGHEFAVAGVQLQIFAALNPSNIAGIITRLELKRAGGSSGLIVKVDGSGLHPACRYKMLA